MLAVATSHWIRVAGYLAVAALTLLARRRERRRATSEGGAWPIFWPLTAVFILAMGLARATDLGELITEAGRSEAIGDGWYESRRGFQAALVVVVGVGWAITVLVACWRVPPRRRRYLPMMIAVGTLAAFAAIRVVSLHQVDTLLYRREVADIRMATLIECCLLVLAAAATGWVPADDGAEPPESLRDRLAA